MSTDTQIAMRTVDLGKSFGPVHPLRDVTLDLESGHQEQELTKRGVDHRKHFLTSYSRLGVCGGMVTCRTALEVSHRAARPDPPYGHR